MSVIFSKVPFVLLCCQGRSGSTLLLRHLNAIDGYHLMGENGGAIRGLLNFYYGIKKSNVERTSGEEHYRMAWANSFDYNLIISNIYDIFKDLFWNPQKRVFGFKEVSFGYDDYITFEDEMNSIKELFPNLKIIFLTRNIEELLQSAWWAESGDFAKQRLLNQEGIFKEYMEKQKVENNNAFTFHISYDDLCEKNNKVKELYSFLEEKFDDASYMEVMKKITK